ncbi:hypothetical protein AB9F35_34930, partial [Rhizobium leguminosarum]
RAGEAGIIAGKPAPIIVAATTIIARVTTGDSGKSMRIAARLAEVVSEADGAGGNVETDTALRKTYDEVKAELTAFTAKSGEGNV